MSDGTRIERKEIIIFFTAIANINQKSRIRKILTRHWRSFERVAQEISLLLLQSALGNT